MRAGAGRASADPASAKWLRGLALSKGGMIFDSQRRSDSAAATGVDVLDAVAATSAHWPSRTLNETMFLGWLVHKWGKGVRAKGKGKRGSAAAAVLKRSARGKGPDVFRPRKHKTRTAARGAGPQRRTPTPRAASLACLARALTARTSSTSMAGFWWSRPSAPRMTCARRFSRKPPAVATGPLSTSARS